MRNTHTQRATHNLPPKGGCAIRTHNAQRATCPKQWMHNTHTQCATRNLPQTVDAQYAHTMRNAQPAPKGWIHIGCTIRNTHTQCTGMLKTLFGRTTHNTQYTYAMHRNAQNPLRQDNAQHTIHIRNAQIGSKQEPENTQYTYTMHNLSQERVCVRTKQCANAQPLNALRKRELTRL